MIVLVTMRTAHIAGTHELGDAISYDWQRLLTDLGMLPVLVPNGLVDPVAYIGRTGARGLLLTGGDDLGLGEREFGGPQPTARDWTEAKLLDAALRRELPVFGVCRGLQLINRYFGGSVARELPEPHAGRTHGIRLLEGVGHLPTGATIEVNSFHDQGVVERGAAPPLAVFAATPGGVIEGLYHPKRPVIAVQWHPERPSPSADLDRLLLAEWRRRCA